MKEDVLLVNTPNVIGYKIVEYKGIITANDSTEDAIYNNDDELEESVLNDLSDKARKMGANAVIGITISSRERKEGYDYSNIYMKAVGTAVVIERQSDE